MNKLIFTLGLVLSTAVLSAQNVDMDRMERDILVAESILRTLISQECCDGNLKHFGYMDIKGSYMAGYGVIFNTPQGLYKKASSNSNKGFLIIDDDGIRIEFDGEEIDLDDDNIRIRNSIRIDDDGIRIHIDEDDLDLDDDQEEIILAHLKKNNGKTGIDNAFKEFLADYGNLIGQLKPDENVAIALDGDRSWAMDQGNSKQKAMITLKAGYIADYKNGKMTRDELIQKIEVTDPATKSAGAKDLSVFASVVQRLYKSDLSSTYFMSKPLQYEYLPGFGAVFSGRVFSSFQHGGNEYSIPTLGLEKVKRDDRDLKVTELYPKFVEAFKNDIIQYGRTIQSLKPSDKLVFKIKMTECNDCGIPENVEFTLPYSTLADHNSGKLSLAKALAAITVKEGAKQ